MATPKAKVRIHHGTMEAAGVTGAGAVMVVHTAAAVNAKGNGIAGHAQVHGRKAASAMTVLDSAPAHGALLD